MDLDKYSRGCDADWTDKEVYILRNENHQLKKCNECMRYQLNNEPFECCCSLDDS